MILVTAIPLEMFYSAGERIFGNPFIAPISAAVNHANVPCTECDEVTSMRKRRSALNRWLTTLALAFFLMPAARAQDKFKVRYIFKGGTDGGGPSTSVTLDAEGNVYGTTPGGRRGQV